MIKLSFISFILLFVSDYISAQTITQEVYSNGGGYIKQINGSIQFNIGEVIVEDYNNVNCHLQQGFEQGYYGLVGLNEIENSNFKISIYPIPTSGIVNILISNNPYNILKIELTDILGKSILLSEIKEHKAIDLSSFTNGVYFLKIFNIKDSDYQLFKIIKNE